MNFNQDAWRLVEEKVNAVVGAAVTAAVAGITKGKGATLPAAADFIGQQFVKTGDGAGLYVATGTTTPAWKAVELAE